MNVGALLVVGFNIRGRLRGLLGVVSATPQPDWGADLHLALKLVGVKTNRAAIGARITVTAEGADGRRRMERSVGSGGSFGASPLQQHIGLGAAVRRVDVEIWWPTSNTRQRFTDVGKNRFFEITEFADAPHLLARPLLPLGKR